MCGDLRLFFVYSSFSGKTWNFKMAGLSLSVYLKKGWAAKYLEYKFYTLQKPSSGPHWTPVAGQFWPPSLMFEIFLFKVQLHYPSVSLSPSLHCIQIYSNKKYYHDSTLMM